MRTIVVFCLLALCVAGAQASCLNDLVQCVRTQPNKTLCVTNLIQCANGKCSCFDVTSATTVFCAMHSHNATALANCVKQFLPDYRACMANCKQQFANFSGLHATEASLVTLPSFSTCSICKVLVGFIEKEGISKGCAYIGTQLGAVCGSFGFLCKGIFNGICSAAIQYIQSNPSASPASVCTYVHSCTSAAEAYEADPFFGGAAIVTLNGDGVGEFLTRSGDFPLSARSKSSAECWMTNTADTYICMEKFQLPSDNVDDVASPDSSNSSSSSSDSWGVVAGVFAILTFVTAIIILFVVRQNKAAQSTGQGGSYVSMGH